MYIHVHTWGTVISQGSLEEQNLQNEYKEVWPRLKGDLSLPTRAGLKVFLPTSKEPD